MHYSLSHTHTQSHTHTHTHTHTHIHYTHTPRRGLRLAIVPTLRMPNPSNPIIPVDTPSARLPDLLQSRSGDDLSFGDMPKEEKAQGNFKGERGGEMEKKKSQTETASLFALLASLPLPLPPLIVPVLSRFDFSKATTFLSLFHFSFAQPSSFFFFSPF